jgi:catechol 2,3-dioxygenase
MDPRVEIGPVHLTVSDLGRALAFYEGVLGFAVAERVGPSAVFLSADGARRHVGLNTWMSGDGDSPSDMKIVHHFALRYPTRASLGAALRRLDDAAVRIESAMDLRTSEALYLRDPDGNGVELYYERPREDVVRTDSPVRPAPTPLDLDALRKAADATEPAAAGKSDAEAALLSDATRARLRDMRISLLNLHKVLLEDAKSAYEMDRGRVGSAARLLQLVINDPWFAWLHPLSGLVVRIDETLRSDAPATDADGILLLNEVTRLLSPEQSPGEFSKRYYDALQRQPAVVVAHAEVRRILKQSR